VINQFDLIKISHPIWNLYWHQHETLHRLYYNRRIIFSQKAEEFHCCQN